MGLCANPLKSVVDEVIQESTARTVDGTTKIFRNLNVIASERENKSWFSNHTALNSCFNRLLMPPIWIRNLSRHDGNGMREEILCDPSFKYYIDDGCTRSLVYAMRLRCGEEKRYIPVKAIHATSWDFMEDFFGHKPQLAGEVRHNSEYQVDPTSSTEVLGQIKWNRNTNKFFR